MTLSVFIEIAMLYCQLIDLAHGKSGEKIIRW